MTTLYKTRGTNISEIDVSHIDELGFWLFYKDREYFVDFDKFPWFRDARISEITDIVVEDEDVFHWPKLDVDLTLQMIRYPERYPLKSKK